MNRRTLLNSAAAATTVGLLAGCLDDAANTDPAGSNDGGDGSGGNGSDSGGNADDDTETADPETEAPGAGDESHETGGTDETTGEDGGNAGEEDDTTEPDGGDESVSDEPQPDGTPTDDDSGSSSSSGHAEAAEFPAGHYRLDSADGVCGDGNDATLDLEDGVATLEGQIAASDPCHRATVEEADFTDSRRFEATIGVKSTSDLCQECLGTVEYHAEFAFDDRVPTTVIVEHASRSGTDEVARVEPED